MSAGNTRLEEAQLAASVAKSLALRIPANSAAQSG